MTTKTELRDLKHSFRSLVLNHNESQCEDGKSVKCLKFCHVVSGGRVNAYITYASTMGTQNTTLTHDSIESNNHSEVRKWSEIFLWQKYKYNYNCNSKNASKNIFAPSSAVEKNNHCSQITFMPAKIISVHKPGSQENTKTKTDKIIVVFPHSDETATLSPNITITDPSTGVTRRIPSIIRVFPAHNTLFYMESRFGINIDSSLAGRISLERDTKIRKKFNIDYKKCQTKIRIQNRKIKTKKIEKDHHNNKRIKVNTKNYGWEFIQQCNYFITQCNSLTKQRQKQIDTIKRLKDRCNRNVSKSNINNITDINTEFSLQWLWQTNCNINDLAIDNVILLRLILFNGNASKSMIDYCHFCFEYACLGDELCDHSDVTCNLKHDKNFCLEYLSRDSKNCEKMFALWLIIEPIIGIRLFTKIKKITEIWMHQRLFYYAKCLFCCNVNTNFKNNSLFTKCIHWLSFYIFYTKKTNIKTFKSEIEACLRSHLVEAHSMMAKCYSSQWTDQGNIKTLVHYEWAINEAKVELLAMGLKNGQMLENAWIDYILFLHYRMFDSDKCVSLLEEMIGTFGIHLSDATLGKIFGLMDEMFDWSKSWNAGYKEKIGHLSVDICKTCIIALSMEKIIAKMSNKAEFASLSALIKRECIFERDNEKIGFKSRIQSLMTWFKNQDSSNTLAIAFACFCDAKSMIINTYHNNKCLPNNKSETNHDIIDKFHRIIQLLSEMVNLNENNNETDPHKNISGIEIFYGHVMESYFNFLFTNWDNLHHYHKGKIKKLLKHKSFLNQLNTRSDFHRCYIHIDILFKLEMYRRAYYCLEHIANWNINNSYNSTAQMHQKSYQIIDDRYISTPMSIKSMIACRIVVETHLGFEHILHQQIDFKRYGFVCQYLESRGGYRFVGVPLLLRCCRMSNLSHFEELISLTCINNDNSDANTRKIIRTIRTSLILYKNEKMKDQFCVMDNVYWKQFAGISIGIISLISMKVEFKGVYDKINKYLNRFVIPNIKENLKFPIVLDQQIVFIAYYCLLLCYFVIGNKTKFKQILKQLNEIKVHLQTPMATSGTCTSNLTKKQSKTTQKFNIVEKLKDIWFDPSALKKKICKLKDNEERAGYFGYFMTKLQGYGTKRSHDMITTTLDEKRRDKSEFARWKNTIVENKKKCNFCHKTCDESSLRVCKRCKNAYYCSKKCQKSDWNSTNHKYKCKIVLRHL